MIDLQLSDEDSDSLTYAHHTTVSVDDVHCNSRIFAGHTAVQLRPGWHFSTTDGCADTMILGADWTWLEYYPDRTSH